MSTFSITSAALVCATGRGIDAFANALRSAQSGLRENDLHWLDFDGVVGQVEGIENVSIRADLSDYDCRNNRLAQIALEVDHFSAAVERAIAKYGADRVGIVLGTSTSGIASTEAAYSELAPDGSLPSWFMLETTHAYNSLAAFVRSYFRVGGPAYIVSTACSSSSKAVVDACQLLASGMCDAVVAGGVDTLCRLTVQGFQSLDLVDPTPARPFDASRTGINIGEAAGFVLIESAHGRTSAPPPMATLVGFGESSDGYHMSAPDPEGNGAERAMADALTSAGLDSKAIDHIVLHGTGTILNDRVENAAVHRLFGDDTSASSYKGWTGHCLGAAGILGILAAIVSIRDGFAPASLNLSELDEAFHAPVLLESRFGSIRYVMTNSFGFGGSNCSVIVGPPR